MRFPGRNGCAAAGLLAAMALAGCGDRDALMPADLTDGAAAGAASDAAPDVASPADAPDARAMPADVTGGAGEGGAETPATNPDAASDGADADPTGARLILSPTQATVLAGVPTTFGLRNAGGASTGKLAMSIDPAQDFFIIATDCPAALEAGATCAVQVSFQPAGAHAGNARLVVSADPGGTAVASLTGTVAGGGPGVKLVVTPAMIAFGNGLVNVESAPVAAIVKNIGTDTSAPLSVSVTDKAFRLTSNGCTGLLAPEQSCTVSLAFAPDTTGVHTGTLQVLAGPAMANAALTGVGTLPAVLAIDPPAKNFGDVAVGQESAAVSFHLTNDGDVDAPRPTLTTTGEFAIKTNGCMAAVPRHAGCSVEVVFGPGSVGTKSGTLTAALPGASATGSATATLSGRGVPAGGLLVTPGTASFADTVVGRVSAQQTLKLVNDGAARVSGLHVTLAASLDFVASSSCGDSLDVGASCDLYLAFKPRAPGNLSAVLVVDATGASVLVGLAGKGLAPARLVARPASLAFGATPAGSRGGPLVVTLRNEGDETADQLNLPPIDGGGFAATSGCPAALVGGASCTVAVAFTPSQPGAREATLHAQTVPAGEVSVALSGQGTKASALTVAPGAVDFGRVALGESSDGSTFTVTNGGDASTGLLSVTLTGAGAAQFTTASDGCSGVTLAAHASCAVSARFKPGAAGTQIAALTVHADPGGDVSAQVQGIGMGPAQLAAPATRDFGYVPLGQQSRELTLRVTNTGGQPSAPLTIDTGASLFKVTRAGCAGAPLMPGQECSFRVQFTPPDVGKYDADLKVSAGPAAALVIKLAGSGVAPAGLGFQDGVGGALQVFDFAEADPGGQAVGATSDTVTVLLRNTSFMATGQIALGIDGDDFVMGPGPALPSLEPGEEAAVVVAFKPSAAGDRRAVLTASAAAGGTARLLLLGRGR